VITEVGGKPIANVSELLSSVAALKPGTAAQFKLQRKDAPMTVTVTAGLRPRPQAAPPAR
jgi:S1-C subfamily serine protease